MASTASHAYVESGSITLFAAVIFDGQTALDGYVLSFGTQPDFDVITYADGKFTDLGWSSANATTQLAVAQPGDYFSSQTVDAPGALPSFFDNPNLSKDFYVAGVIHTSQLLPQEAANGQATALRYGWAHMVIDGDNQVSIVNSAVAFNEPGIVVGTLTAVPEPSTFALTSLGLAALITTLCRQRKNQHPS